MAHAWTWHDEIPDVRDVLPGIAARAQALDLSGDWPADDLAVLKKVGAMRWAVPFGRGGEGLSAIELHFRYEAIASASVAVALIFSQRDSAIDLIDSATESSLCEVLLPKLAEDEIFATVGIAQLTTSRQGGPPALRATAVDDGYRIDGVIPWSSGAGRSDYVVAGAVLEDGQQVLFAMPTDLPGLRIEPPMPLVALRATWTAALTCEGVMLNRRYVLRGPVEKALAGRQRGGLALGQTFIAMGLACGAINLIGEHRSDAAREAHARFEQQLATLRRRIIDLCAPGKESDAASAAPELRGRVNDLALRATHAAVTLYKGTALLADHPAQRLAREAMFLLVWSCPSPVIDCTVGLLSSVPSPGTPAEG